MKISSKITGGRGLRVIKASILVSATEERPLWEEAGHNLIVTIWRHILIGYQVSCFVDYIKGI